LFGNFALGFLEGCLDKTANEYWTEVAIPHVLSSKEFFLISSWGKNKNIVVYVPLVTSPWVGTKLAGLDFELRFQS